MKLARGPIPILVAFAAMASAQDPAPLIRTNTRLVLLDIVVTDKKGRPIPDLTQSDLTILENGIPQKIVSFDASFYPVGRVSPTPEASRTIILLDQLNISFPDLAYARDRIVLFLKQNPVQRSPTALMAVGLKGLTMIENFTTDGMLLENKLIRLPVLVANPTDGYIDPRASVDHAREALGALTQIARAAVGYPYSLNVIWVTSGFSGLLQAAKPGGAIEAGLRGVANLLIRSRMQLYTIDPSGVIPKSTLAGPASAGGSVMDGETSAAKLLNFTHSEHLAADVVLSQMTAMMGGRSFYGRNDVDVALSEAAAEGSSAYALTYSPSDTHFDGSYRKILVRVSVEGATARTRQGYYATANEPELDPKLRDVRLTNALGSQLTYAGWELTCPVTYDPATRHLKGKLTVTPRAQGRETDQTRELVVAASYTEDHQLLNKWSWDVNWKTPWTDHPSSTLFDKAISSEARMVRFLVSDAVADRIGTCEFTLPPK